ncbi:MAG: hypothetical protein PHI34_02715, partial [Acidobacteriota bacterium]|nr:hypothetical protein [Acidobacteriota bacterium]
MPENKRFVVILAAAAVVFLVAWTTASGSQAGEPAGQDLNVLLDKLTAYAARLEGAVLDFICREVISEKINYALDQTQERHDALNDWAVGGAFGSSWISRPSARTTNDYVYDYQCVRSRNGLIRETRTLLEENGKRKNEPDAKLKTQVFVFGTPLLGPVGIFAERYRPFYDYKISGRDEVNGRPALIIEAIPASESSDVTNLYGKAWVGAEDGEIFKLEWSESRVGRRDIFAQRGERYKLKPRITL